MPVATAGAWIGAGLLVLAGVVKLRRPAAPGRALVLAGLPGGTWSVRALGVVEVVAAVAGLALGGVVWAAQAALYLAFSVFVARERGRPNSDCGCFGHEGVPVTGLHVLVDAALAAAAATAAVVGAPGVLAAFTVDGSWLAVPLAVLAVLAVRMLLVDLPVLFDAVRRAEVPS